MNLRLAMPGVLVDLNRLAELQGIVANGMLEIGAMTRQIAVERSPEVEAGAPLLAEALRHVAFPGVRSQGTIGGTLAHADPAGETPAVLSRSAGRWSRAARREPARSPPTSCSSPTSRRRSPRTRY